MVLVPIGFLSSLMSLGFYSKAYGRFDFDF